MRIVGVEFGRFVLTGAGPIYTPRANQNGIKV
jgi:hypothetical protein